MLCHVILSDFKQHFVCVRLLCTVSIQFNEVQSKVSSKSFDAITLNLFSTNPFVILSFLQ